MMQTALQLVVTGVQIASVYVLFSLGLTLIFGVMKVVNFAHGQFFTLTALLVATLVPLLFKWGVALPIAFLVACLIGILASVIVGMFLYQFGFRFSGSASQRSASCYVWWQPALPPSFTGC